MSSKTGCCSETTHTLQEDSLPAANYHTKCTFVGASSVGKTSLIDYLVNRRSSEYTVPTIGVMFQTIAKEGSTGSNLQLWDTAGQEKYRSVAPMYIRGAHIVVLVYAVNDPRSYEELVHYREMQSQYAARAVVIVIANKVDLLEDNCHLVTPETVKNDYPGAIIIPTSAMTGEGIDDLRDKLLTLADSI